MAIKSWSTTAGDNDDADATINWAENQAPSTVNNSGRAMMAAIRSWYEDVEFRDWGHTVTRTGNTTFTVATDVTSIYVANRQIRCADSSTLYGYIVSSSYSAPNTTVTVSLDSGNLSASLTAVALGLDPSRKSIDATSVRNALSSNNVISMTAAINQAEGSDVASSATCDIWSTTGNTVHVTGTTTITSFGTAPQVGATRRVIFDGALVLTHGANLNLPGGVNRTTAAGDSCLVYADTTTQFDIFDYTTANGKPLTYIVEVGPISPTATNTNYTVAHNLGVKPKLLSCVARNKSAEGGYAVGNDVILSAHDATTGRFTPYVTSTNCGFVTGGAAFVFRNLNTPSTDYVVNWNNWDVYFYVTL